MEWIILVVCVATLAISAYTFYKVRKIHLATYEIGTRVLDVHKESTTLYAQLVAWHDLNRLLQFKQPLPPLRGWAASPDFLLVIAQDALQRQPEVIVECSSGTSTLTLARCCQINGKGRVFSLEQDPEYAAATRKRLLEQGLDDWATIVDAPLVSYEKMGGQRWYSLEGLDATKPIDLLVIDGPPWNTAALARYPALPMLIERLSSNAAIYLDDAERDEEKATLKRWSEEIPDLGVKKNYCEKGCAFIYFKSAK
jgi:predicted O-methyltransferase YrrM